MTTNIQFTQDALSTESVVDSINLNRETFIYTIKAAIASAQLLDQFKRSMFYGSKFTFDQAKLDHYAAQLRSAAISLEGATRNITSGEVSDLEVDTRIVHGVVGTATEAGELLEALLVYIETGEFDTINLKEEIGDVQWYQHILANAANTTIDECLEAVVQKLKDKKKGRYKDGYSHAAAISRDVSNERELLEAAL